MQVVQGRAGLRRIAGLLVVAAALVVTTLLVACSTDSGAPEPSVQPSPALGAVSRGEYVGAFNAINLRLLEDTRLMNQIAISASIDGQARFDSEETTRLILDNLNGELSLAQTLEPVPSSVAGAHESLKAAMMLYIEAASLLLPPEDTEGLGFDFSAYQALLMDAGKQFHSAGSALSMNVE